MRIIFLDFDGVLVFPPLVWERLEGMYARKVRGLNRGAVARLNRIVKETGARVVITSTWRLHEPLEYLRGYLWRAGFAGVVLGATPDLTHDAEDSGTLVQIPAQRGTECLAWLSQHPEAEAFVAIDDDADLSDFPRSRWVRVVDGWQRGGLQDIHAEAAIRALLHP